MWRTSGSDKDDSFLDNDCLLNPIDDQYTLRFMDLKSPNSVENRSASQLRARLLMNSENVLRERFQASDDLHLLQDHTYTSCVGGDRQENTAPGSSYVDDESDSVRLLAGGYYETSITSSQQRLAYSLDKYDEECIFEPSFEVALLNSDQLTVNIPEPESRLPVVADENAYIPPNPRDNIFLKPMSTPLRRPKPQRLYDKHGIPFLHVFHTRLTTIYEDTSESEVESSANQRVLALFRRQRDAATQPPNQKRARVQTKPPSQEFMSEELVMKSRWEFSLHRNQVEAISAIVAASNRPRRSSSSRHRKATSLRFSALQEI